MLSQMFVVIILLFLFTSGNTIASYNELNICSCSSVCLQAVKRSRVKSKQKASQTKDRVDDLKVDNEKLQERIKQKHDQLKVLKDLFLDTAKAKQEAGVENINLHKLLADSDDESQSGSNAT